jgi:hypothetical protein
MGLSDGRPRFYVGVDLAQLSDFTAVVVAERQAVAGPAHYHLRHLEHWRDVSYPEQVARVAKLLRDPVLQDAALIIDRTGVGVPLYDMFRQAGLDPIGVSIHGGDQVSQDGREYRVPKRDLVATVGVLLQTRRLPVAAALPDAALLLAELRNFRVKFDPRTAHDSYAAWREEDHDDYVLATALAVWYAERGYVPLQIFLGGAPVVGG